MTAPPLSPVAAQIALRSARAGRLLRKLGLVHGLLLGLAVAAGAFGPDALALSTVPLPLLYPRLLLGSLLLIMVGGAAGWLAAWSGRAGLSGLLWLLAAGLMTWLTGHWPYEGRSLLIWLADRRFWGLPLYPFAPAGQARLLMAGFFFVLVLTILGLIQPYRLEGVLNALTPRDRLGAQAFFLLAAPLLAVVGLGLAADNLVNRPLRVAPLLVHEAIRTGRTYPGDLFALSRERGVNYNAIAGVREQMSAVYTLQPGKVELGMATDMIVVIHFDNGAWINCRVLADQLSHCYDASLPYLRGFAALLAAQAPEVDCPQCVVRAGEALSGWLRQRGERFTGPPQITRLAQWGAYVLMRADDPAGGYSVECLFAGFDPTTVQRCREVP